MQKGIFIERAYVSGFGVVEILLRPKYSLRYLNSMFMFHFHPRIIQI